MREEDQVIVGWVRGLFTAEQVFEVLDDRTHEAIRGRRAYWLTRLNVHATTRRQNLLVPRWTDREDAVLTNLFRDLRVVDEAALREAMRQLPHRNAQAIHMRLRKLTKLRAADDDDNERVRRGGWTSDEDEVIIAMRDGVITERDAMQQLPHRSWAAIEMRRKHLRATTSTSAMPYTTPASIIEGVRGSKWTENEDELIISVRSRHRRDIDAVRALMPLLPHRSGRSIRDRLLHLKNKLAIDETTNEDGETKINPAMRKRKRGEAWTADEDELIESVRNNALRGDDIMRELHGRATAASHTARHY